MAVAGLACLLSMAPAGYAKDTVKLTFIGPLTGGSSTIGPGGRNSADLALKTRNADPKMLLIDEPSLGLSPLFVKENFRVTQDINARGITILLVEQNARQTLAISDYGYVLSQGRMVAQGPAAELSENVEVQAAYFG